MNKYECSVIIAITICACIVISIGLIINSQGSTQESTPKTKLPCTGELKYTMGDGEIPSFWYCSRCDTFFNYNDCKHNHRVNGSMAQSSNTKCDDCK